MIINQSQLKEIRSKHKDKKIVIGLGSFDMFHWEHLQFINDCKKLGDILVIAVKTNESVTKKGVGKPIIDEKQRLEIVDNIKAVDYTVLADEEVDIEALREKYNITQAVQEVEWWKFFYPIFEKLQPNILHYEVGHPVQNSRDIYLKEKNITGIARE